MLWYAVIAVDLVGSLALLYYGFTKDASAGELFQFKHLFVGRRSIRSSSRKKLLIEGFFLLTLSMVMLVYELLR